MPDSHGSGPRHLLSVLVEDYFQVGAFRKHIEPDQWDRFESRLFRNTEAALDLLARHDVKATFFVLGWNAEQWPELIRRIAKEGHEVASGGYHHDSVREMPREEFCERLQRAREAIESAAGQPVLGYRMAEGWLQPDDVWLLDHLAEEGYAYDSSLMPRGRTFHHQQWRRAAHLHTSESGRLWEFPPASLRLPFADLPIAGGNYFRQIPHTLMKHLIARCDRTQTDPLMLYFHVWELDVEQPSLSAVDRLTRIRHYRNPRQAQLGPGRLLDEVSVRIGGRVSCYGGRRSVAAAVRVANSERGVWNAKCGIEAERPRSPHLILPHYPFLTPPSPFPSWSPATTRSRPFRIWPRRWTA